MKKINCLIKQTAVICLSSIAFLTSASAVSAAKFSYTPSSGTLTGSTQIQITLDPEGVAVDSAVAVVTFDPNKVEIESVAAGSFFDSVVTDTSQSGEAAITGTFNIGNVGGKSTSGTMATLTIKPKISTGTITLSYRCSSADIDDSNIMNTSGTNLLATDVQCGANVGGSYTVGSSSGGTTSPTTAPTSAPTTAPTSATKGDQPVLPEELPQSGPRNWLKWITSGLALIGIGLLLL